MFQTIATVAVASTLAAARAVTPFLPHIACFAGGVGITTGGFMAVRYNTDRHLTRMIEEARSASAAKHQQMMQAVRSASDAIPQDVAATLNNPAVAQLLAKAVEASQRLADAIEAAEPTPAA